MRPDKRKTAGFKFFNDEMIGLRLSRRDYKFYLRIKNIAVELAFEEEFFIYFRPMIKRLDELAMSSKTNKCFLFCAESLEYIGEQFTFQ